MTVHRASPGGNKISLIMLVIKMSVSMRTDL